jgi:CheY-like chemotaxis protein
MTRLNRILVVDDDENDLQLTVSELERSGNATSIDVARDGMEALLFLRKHAAPAGRRPGPPDIVLLDLHMPCVDGLEVLREMRRDAALRDIPVVVFTSSPNEVDVRRSYELGANAYVVKPMDYGRFGEVVRQFWIEHNVPPPVAGSRAASLSAAT